MMKRAADLTVLKTIRGRGSTLSSALCLRTLFTCTVVALTLGGGATQTHALEGVSGEHPDFEGAFQPSSCQDLQAETGVNGDDIFACDSDGETCRLFSADTETDQGVAIGFCEATSVAPARDGEVHLNTEIGGTAFGGVIGISGSTSDIFCETFEPLRKVCVRISPGTCTGSGCGSGGGFIVVRNDTCDTVKALLAESVTSDPFQNIRWALFTDSHSTGEAGSEALLVCTGNSSRLTSLSGQAIATGVVIDFWGNKLSIFTPHTVYLNGVRYCKKYVPPESITHCP